MNADEEKTKEGREAIRLTIEIDNDLLLLRQCKVSDAVERVEQVERRAHELRDEDEIWDKKTRTEPTREIAGWGDWD